VIEFVTATKKAERTWVSDTKATDGNSLFFAKWQMREINNREQITQPSSFIFKFRLLINERHPVSYNRSASQSELGIRSSQAFVISDSKQ